MKVVGRAKVSDRSTCEYRVRKGELEEARVLAGGMNSISGAQLLWLSDCMDANRNNKRANVYMNFLGYGRPVA
jgi:hypothetical protein